MSQYPAYSTYESWQKNLRRNPTSPSFPDTAVRWTPDIDMPEIFGIHLYNAMSSLSTISFLQRTFYNDVVIENQPNLIDVEMPYFTQSTPPTGSLAALIIKNNPRLASLNTPNITLPLYGSSISNGTASIDFAGNALNSFYVDQLFNALALSLSSGHAYYAKIDTSGGSNAAPTSASSLALSSLYLGASLYHITVVHN